jgi:hypothetical protein
MDDRAELLEIQRDLTEAAREGYANAQVAREQATRALDLAEVEYHEAIQASISAGARLARARAAQQRAFEVCATAERDLERIESMLAGAEDALRRLQDDVAV